MCGQQTPKQRTTIRAVYRRALQWDVQIFGHNPCQDADASCPVFQYHPEVHVKFLIQIQIQIQQLFLLRPLAYSLTDGALQKSASHIGHVMFSRKIAPRKAAPFLHPIPVRGGTHPIYFDTTPRISYPS